MSIFTPKFRSMQRSLIFFGLVLISIGANAQFPSNYTPTYSEIIATYERIARDNPEYAKLDTIGSTDAGEPLHYFVIDKKGNFSPDSAESNEQVVCMIMNGIHAGEACGVNASIQFAMEQTPMADENVIYVILPIYNVGGALNRNSTSRANQVGPAEYGFRANAKNLDLNRDFIKCDSDNAKAFTKLYHLWKPHVFIDTHTTNGADYQPTLTLLSSFPDKLVPMQATFVEREMTPYLFEKMKDSGDEMIPYVNLTGRTPDEGLKAFLDYPRYGSGYVSLFNTIAFLTEAHMLKPFDQRVASTLNFIKVMHGFLSSRSEIIIKLKNLADAKTKTMDSFATKWRIGDDADSLEFPGYQAEKTASLISGRNYISYDREKPYRKNVPYYNEVIPYYEADLPEFYIIPAAWDDVIERLKLNRVVMTRLKQDTTLKVTSVYARYYETSEEPYEGHYPHSNVGVSERKEEVEFRKGAYLIPTDQVANRYLAHVLDPQSYDSFFAWNFFDSILTQKEYFSAYLFEETALKILQRDATLRRSFDTKKATDPDFAEDGVAQLRYIYNNSSFHEPGHLRVPIYRLN